MRTLLVTGHLGFIASTFCERNSGKYRIIGLDNGGWGSMPENLAAGVISNDGDIADEARVETVLRENRVDSIVNFAAESHVDRSIQGDLSFWHSNVLGTRILARAARSRNIRLVQVSTDEVYGDALEESRPWSEDSPISPKNPYSVTKASAELLLAGYHRTDGLDVVVTRGANTVGPRQFPEKAIPKAISSFLSGKPFPLFKSPARRMWLHVEDHADGVLAALEKGRSGQIYNLGPRMENESYTHEVIRRVRERVGRGKIQLVEDRKAYDLRYWMSSDKAEKEIGWKARIGLEECLNKTVDWYLTHTEWLEAANARLFGASS